MVYGKMTLCAWTLKSLMPTEGRQVSSNFPLSLLCRCVGGSGPGLLEFLHSKPLKLTCLRGFRLERAVLGIAASVSGNVLSCYCSVVALKVSVKTVQKSNKRHVCSFLCQRNSPLSILLVLAMHHSFCDDALLEARRAANGGGRFPTSPW